MKRSLFFLLTLALSLVLSAQVKESTFFPSFYHHWNPVVGEGATYRVSDLEGVSVNTTFAIVGKQGDAFQFEVVSQETVGLFTMRMLVTGDPMDDEQLQELLFQAEGETPVSMDRATLQVLMARKNEMAASIGDMGGGGTKGIGAMGGEIVSKGEEKIRTLAGEFVCQKFTLGDTKHPTTVWFNDSVYPFGVVRLRSGMEELELIRLEKNISTRITGTPIAVDTRTILLGEGEPSGEVTTMEVDTYDQDDLDTMEKQNPGTKPEEATP